ncbi:MAG: hypothetical protein E7515_02490 [Ruminococcaceae bacterium]|nr:hypothetical protein [Oscillospiraceae bacterium]
MVNTAFNKKELPYFRIGSSYGGNQEWFDGVWMKMGGCAAETACETSIYLDLYKGTSLYPFDIKSLNKEDYIKFGSIMKPYLRPRMSGIDKLSIYIEGFGQFLKDRKSNITLSGVEGTENVEKAREAVRKQLENEIPVPYLCLKHSDKSFDDYEWHWFILNGFETDGEAFIVKAVTYSEFEWLDFNRLWDTGYAQKGGLIIVNL